MSDRKIQITHLPDVDSFTKQQIMEIIYKHYDRLQLKFPTEISLEVHFKSSKKADSKDHFEIKTHLNGPGLTLNSSHSDWNPEAGIRRVMEVLEKEAEKKKRK